MMQGDSASPLVLAVLLAPGVDPVRQVASVTSLATWMTDSLRQRVSSSSSQGGHSEMGAILNEDTLDGEAEETSDMQLGARP